MSAITLTADYVSINPDGRLSVDVELEMSPYQREIAFAELLQWMTDEQIDMALDKHNPEYVRKVKS